MSLHVLEDLRPPLEQHLPDYMYACYRLGHFLSDTGICHSCLRRFVLMDDDTEEDEEE